MAEAAVASPDGFLEYTQQHQVLPAPPFACSVGGHSYQHAYIFSTCGCVNNSAGVFIIADSRMDVLVSPVTQRGHSNMR